MAEPIKNLGTQPQKVEGKTALAAGQSEVSPFSLDDPFAAQRYLISKGWQPLGSPRSDLCRWWDPTRSKEEKTEEVPIIAPHFEGYDERTKAPLYKDKPVMVKTLHGQYVPAKQKRVTPPGHSYSLNEAIEIQVGRDEAEQEARIKDVKVKEANVAAVA